MPLSPELLAQIREDQARINAKQIALGAKENPMDVRRAATKPPERILVEPRAILARGDSITPEPIDWIWRDWFAAGKLHLGAGAPGTGKTTLAIAIAATITIGGRWPDGSRAPTGNIVMWSGEDDPADVLIPRFRAAGADMTRVHIVRGVDGPDGILPFDPAGDTEALAAVLMPDVRLLIVDPIVTAVAGDSHKNAEVRRGLQPLVDLAARHRCALLGITHLTKGTAGRDPVERVTGSLAFGALARVVLLAGQQQAESEKPAQRLLMRAKSNIGPDTGGYNYDLRLVELDGYPGVQASAVMWGQPVEGTARELMAQTEAAPEEEPEGDAGGFLAELLSDGPMSAKDVYREADGAGYSRTTMKRAKASIGAVTRKQGMSGGWVWSLPDPAKSPRESRRDRRGHTSEGDPFGPFGDPFAPVTPNSELGANGAPGVIEGATNESEVI